MSELIYHDVIQGTDQWKQVKAGKFGGTTADTFLVAGKDHDGIGAGLRTLIYQKAAEYFTGPNLDGYCSPEMERGNELEMYARQRYETENFVKVQQVGYIQMGQFFGVSPDGLVGDDGGVEIKCPQPKTYLQWIDSAMTVADIPKGYYCQMQWLMFITGRAWCDYVVFCPEFTPLDYVQTRVERNIIVMRQFTEKSQAVAREVQRIITAATPAQ